MIICQIRNDMTRCLSILTRLVLAFPWRHAGWLLSFFGCLGQLSAVVYSAQEASRPNIIIIMSDDMGFSDLGCYGGEIHTPYLDALAASGLRYTQFYNTARCCPTRASLLTGLYPHQAGIGHMMDDRGFPGYRGDLNSACRTIAEVLRNIGYRTYMVGKWHVTRFHDPEGPKHNWPLQRGFDRFYGTIHGGGSYYDPWSLVRDNTMISPYADPEYRPEHFYYTDAISDHAVRFIEEHAEKWADRPFFLYVAYTAAHWPLHALPEDIERYRGKYDTGYEPIRQARFARAAALVIIDPEQGMCPTAADWEKIMDRRWEAACMEVYAAMVDRMDQGIGRIITALQKTRRFENTVIFYLQDNGGCAETVGRSGNAKHPNIPRPPQPTLPPLPPDAFPTRGSIPDQTRDGFPVRMGPRVMPGPEDTYIAYGLGWANVSNTPFREYKHWVHEGGISTPLIAHWPKGIKVPGQLCHEPGHVIDLAPTCYAIAGAEYPQDAPPLEGISLLPTFTGQALPQRELYWEHEGNRAVRSGNWKLVAKHNQPWELYDVSRDRVEMRNLARQYPERVHELSSRYESWAQRVGVQPWPPRRQ